MEPGGERERRQGHTTAITANWDEFSFWCEEGGRLPGGSPPSTSPPAAAYTCACTQRLLAHHRLHALTDTHAHARTHTTRQGRRFLPNTPAATQGRSPPKAIIHLRPAAAARQLWSTPCATALQNEPPQPGMLHLHVLSHCTLGEQAGAGALQPTPPPAARCLMAPVSTYAQKRGPLAVHGAPAMLPDSCFGALAESISCSCA